MAPPNDGPGSIYSRNKDACLENTAQLFRALCDTSSRRGKSLNKYTSEDLIIAGLDANLLSPSHPASTPPIVYSRTSDPSARGFLKERFEPWTAYRIHDDPEFAEVDMMSSAMTYKVTIMRKHDEDGRIEEIEALCSSVWRQGAGGEWTCCLHHMQRSK